MILSDLFASHSLLCDFVNSHSVTVVAIVCNTSGEFVLFYREV